SVWALHSHSGTLYVGGEFTLVGPATGSAVLVNAATGANSGLFPKVEGIVLTAIRDGVGGWYLGGLFNSVGGVARQNLAHGAADYTVTSWNPSANNQVDALALVDSTVYAVGYFNQIGGQAHFTAVAIDAATGIPTAWNPLLDNYAHVLATDGSTLYVAGEFEN